MADTAIDRELAGQWVHICVDMQSLFAEDTAWRAPWLRRVLPAVEALAERAAARTIFTRFLPPRVPSEANGAWQLYYERWPQMVRDKLAPELLDLVPPLARLVPPGRVLDKAVYSPWVTGELHRVLRAKQVTALVVTGGETDVCVLATVLGAIDLGYRVVLPTDALFGSTDATHDAVLDIYRNRYQTQLTITNASELLDLWQEQAP